MIRFQPPTISNKIVQIVNHLITHRQRFHHECNPILFLKNKKNKSPTQKKAKKNIKQKTHRVARYFLRCHQCRFQLCSFLAACCCAWNCANALQVRSKAAKWLAASELVGCQREGELATWKSLGNARVA